MLVSLLFLGFNTYVGESRFRVLDPHGPKELPVPHTDIPYKSQ